MESFLIRIVVKCFLLVSNIFYLFNFLDFKFDQLQTLSFSVKKKKIFFGFLGFFSFFKEFFEAILLLS